MIWNQGRTTLEEMLALKELERVPASRERAEVMLRQARGHLESAQAIVSTDPIGAYQLLYDSTRKALNAVLENQGLRATSRGGHIATIEAVTAQLVPPMDSVLRPTNRMRQRRNKAEYPDGKTPLPDAEEVGRDLPKARAIPELAENVLDQMAPF